MNNVLASQIRMQVSTSVSFMPGLMILATAAAVGDIVVTCASERIEAVPGKAKKVSNLQILIHMLDAKEISGDANLCVWCQTAAHLHYPALSPGCLFSLAVQ